MLQLCDRVAGYGADHIYHDQVTAAPPLLCFNPAHGHRFNDPDVWLGGGFKPMFAAIRSRLPSKHPDLVHSSEDASEPYLKLLDGFHIWRWTHQQIPLFQSIYCGRTQYSGRTYGDTLPPRQNAGPWMKRRDARAFYAKMAEQLVNGEQLGSISLDGDGDSHNPAAMLFTKRMAHLRLALIDYLNGNEMLKPLAFRRPMPQLTTFWNAFQDGSGGGGNITHDTVRHSYWENEKTHVRMAVFVNSSADSIAFEPVINDTRPALTLADASPPRYGSDFKITLKPYGCAMIISGPEDLLKAEAERLAPIMSRIDKFLPMSQERGNQKTAGPNDG
jgi:hypothetical protein